MGAFETITGSCFCGANQFQLTEPAVDTHHCHCSICRRVNAAPFVTWSIFPRSGFKWTKGPQLHTFHSSATVHRNRCTNCGSNVTVDLDAIPDKLFVNRSNFSDIKADPGHPPATLRHAFWPDRVPWLEINDNVRKTQGFDT